MNTTYINYYGIKPIYFDPIHIAPDEIFLPIENNVIENIAPYYIVSNYGRVYNYYNNKFIHISYKKSGYMSVSLQTLDPNIRKEILLHRLVLLVFNYIKDSDKLDVNHKDGLKYINFLSNLEWCTTRENNLHALQNKLRIPVSGENHYKSKITVDDANYICQLLSSKYSIKEIVDITGISRDIITDIKRRRTWKYISNNYNW